MFASVLPMKVIWSFWKQDLIDQSDKNYPHDALLMFTENAPTVLKNQAVPNNVIGEVYSKEANDKLKVHCRYPFSVIYAAQNQKQTSTWGLAKLL